ncbi:hypothetical protein [Thalassotalea piscium]|uniref:EAL domain-containing protein n=1 Tax=Thalassotalea piscium TaxID=1230533 RepID=A0A7X0NGY0_9GAMM|nr:hypothetical protein [Thalassotalea piscium]MBB6543155.1 hypothetical protein [Thalassotalea piscium]
MIKFVVLIYFLIGVVFSSIAIEVRHLINVSKISINASYILDSIQTPDGYIYTLTTQGVYRFDGQQTVLINDIYEIPRDDDFGDFIQYNTKTNQLLIADYESNIRVLDIATNTFTIHKKNTSTNSWTYALHNYNGEIFSNNGYGFQWYDPNFNISSKINFKDKFGVDVIKSVVDTDTLYASTADGIYSVDLNSKEVNKIEGTRGYIDALSVNEDNIAYKSGCNLFYKSAKKQLMHKFALEKNVKDCDLIKIMLWKDKIIVSHNDSGMYLWDTTTDTKKQIDLAVAPLMSLSNIKLNLVKRAKDGFILGVAGFGILLLPHEQFLQNTYSLLSDGSPAGNVFFSKKVENNKFWLTSGRGAFLVNEQLEVLDSITSESHGALADRGFTGMHYDHDNNYLWLVGKGSSAIRYNTINKTIKEFEFKNLYYISSVLGENIALVDDDRTIFTIGPTGERLGWSFDLDAIGGVTDVFVLSDKTVIAVVANTGDIVIYKKNNEIARLKTTDFVDIPGSKFQELVIINDSTFVAYISSFGIVKVHLNPDKTVQSINEITEKNHQSLVHIIGLVNSNKNNFLYALAEEGLLEINLNTYEIKTLLSNRKYFYDVFSRLKSISDTKILLFNMNSTSVVDIDTFSSSRNNDFNITMFEVVTSDAMIKRLVNANSLNLAYHESLSKVYISTLTPFSSPDVVFRYKVDSQDWLLAPRNGEITLPNLEPGKYKLSIEAKFNGVDIIIKDYMINFNVPFLQSPLFRIITGVVVIFIILGLFILYEISKLKRLKISKELKLLSECFEQITTPQIVIDFTGKIIHLNKSFFFLTSPKHPPNNVMDITSNALHQEKWRSAISEAKVSKYWSGNLFVHTESKSELYIVNMNVLAGVTESIVVSLTSFSESEISDNKPDINSHIKFRHMLERHIKREEGHQVLFGIVSIKDKDFDSTQLMKQLESITPGLESQRLYAKDIGFAFSYTTPKDWLYVISSLHEFMDGFQWSVGLMTSNTEVSEPVDILVNCDIALQKVRMTKGENVMFFGEEDHAYYLKHYSDILLDKTQRQKELQPLIGPIIDSKSGLVTMIQLHLGLTSTKKSQYIGFLPIHIQKYYYNLYFESVLEHAETLNQANQKIVIPIPLRLLLLKGKEMEKYLKGVLEKLNTQVILLIQIQSRRNLKNYSHVFDRLSSEQWQVGVEIDNIDLVSFEDLSICKSQYVFIDASSLDRHRYHSNPLDGILSHCLTLNQSIVLSGISNEESLIFKNKGFDYLAGDRIQKAENITFINDIIQSNYLLKISHEVIQINRKPNDI